MSTAKKQFKVTLPESTISRIEHYRSSDQLSQSQFIENAVDAYIKVLNEDYRGSDLFLHRQALQIEQNKLTLLALEDLKNTLTSGFDTLFNLTKV